MPLNSAIILCLVLFFLTQCTAKRDVLPICCVWSTSTDRNTKEQAFRNETTIEHRQPLKHFPEGGKHCCTFNSTKGAQYFVRGEFMYENFDQKQDPPVFDVLIGTRKFRVNSSAEFLVEAKVNSTSTSTAFCLKSIANGGTPFVTKLKILPLIVPVFLKQMQLRGSLYRGKVSEPRSSVVYTGSIVGVSLSVMVIATIVTAMCIYRRRRSKPPKQQSSPERSPPNYISTYEHPKEMPSTEVRQFSLKELEDGLGNRIGEGGFGFVYRGTLYSGQEVAIKVRSAQSSQGFREFTAELTFLSQIRHDNLVPLLGYCVDGPQQMLVYPYMSNGSLQDRLYGEASKRKPLDWQTRLSIALGAAKGLSFLHTSGQRSIIHRDVKSSNILLDHSMVAKVADFGFSRFAPQEDDSLVSLEVRGTAGYLDPEYYMTQKLTPKSDVFSFGVVLLEIICGREPLDIRRPRAEASLVEWATPFIVDANIQAIIDPVISASFTPEAMWRVVEVALSSVEPYAERRPDMNGVARELEDAFIIENNASQYMASMDSIGSFRRSTSSIKIPVFPTPVIPFDPSPAFSETMDSPHPR